MRMRRKDWARALLPKTECFIADPAPLRGRWASAFPAEQPLYVELGCGKGVATSKMARQNPGINYLAIDISPDVMGVTCKNITQAYEGAPIDNIRLTLMDITHISEYLAPEDRAERIYIRFCNPWTHSAAHHKRRLTHPRQLMQYRDFLTERGEIWFKTDDEDLFRDSLVYFADCGFETVYLTEDLAGSGFQPNFVSEHEQLYMSQGVSIRFGIFRKVPGPVSPDPAWKVPGYRSKPEETENQPE